MFFNGKKNGPKEKISFIKNNDDLLEELKEKGINDKDILNAIQKVPRELFVNKISFQWAYENMPLPIDCEQTISQPYVVAYMIDCLKLRKTDTVLEIGTGTGYQTAIISHLCHKIYTIEIFKKLFDQAKLNIGKLKIKNVIYKLDNGISGWEEKNFFDAIIVSAASEEISSLLLKNLKINGKLIFPKKESTGSLPAVVLLHGSGGPRIGVKYWSKILQKIGIVTFIVDSNSARGCPLDSKSRCKNYAEHQGMGNIIDAYRALELLSTHPQIDPNRIALMGFSVGGKATLYASVKRFQKMWGTPGLEFAAYIPFYPACNITFDHDEQISDKPIRIFYGEVDDDFQNLLKGVYLQIRYSF